MSITLRSVAYTNPDGSPVEITVQRGQIQTLL